MKASELIKKLEALIAAHGDRECMVQPGHAPPFDPNDVVFADHAYRDGDYVVSDPDDEHISPVDPGDEAFVVTE